MVFLQTNSLNIQKSMKFSTACALFLILLSFSITHKAAGQASLNMTLLGQWDPDTLPTAGTREYNDIWGYTDCDGHEYAIMGSAAMVHVVDIENPAEPVELARFPGGQVTTWRDMKVYRDRAYAVSDATNEGLMIFDLSQLPDTVIKTYQSNVYFGSAHNIFIDNGKLYCVGTNTQSQGMIVLDLTQDPDNPQLLASVPLPPGGYVHDVYVKNDTAYCSHGFSGFYIWDFSNPQNPVELASIPTNGYNHSSWVLEDGKYAIYAEEVPTGLPLGIADLTNLPMGDIETALTFKFPLLAPTHTNNTPHNPFIRGDYAILSYYEDGVQIFDLSDPLDPKQVAYYDTHENTSYNGYNGCWGVYPFFPSGIVAASDINGGLMLFSADSIDWKPIAPVLTPEITVQISDTLACVGEVVDIEVTSTAGDVFLMLTDTTVPAPPAFSADAPATFSFQAVNGHCTAESGPFEIDFTEPLVPQIVLDTPSNTLFASGSGTYEWFQDGLPLLAGGVDSLVMTAPGNYYVIATDSNGCIASSDTIVVLELATSTSGPDRSGYSLEVFPNPATSHIFVRGIHPHSGWSMQIVDVSGKIWTSELWNAAPISISHLPPGLYLLKATHPKGGILLKKIVKI